MINQPVRYLLLALIATLAGCATVPQEPALSLSVKGVPSEDLRGIVGSVYVWRGWTLEQESNSAMSFSVQNNGMVASLYGSKYDSNVFNREKITFFKVGDKVNFIFNQVIVGNRGSAFENETPVTSNNNRERNARIRQISRMIKENHPSAVVIN